jgi:quercetin dioxygenase-like cupin family protein
MSHIRLTDTARQLPEAWSSRVLAQFGGANLKLLRMDAGTYPEECHDYDEGLLVLDGEMVLQIGGQDICVRAGEIYVVPAGVAHGVGAGSRGTLLILDV